MIVCALLGGAFGAIIGAIIGAAIGAINSRTSTGFDWAIIAGIGIGLGTGISGKNWLVTIICGVSGTAIGRFVVPFVGRILGAEVHEASMTKKAVGGYFSVH